MDRLYHFVVGRARITANSVPSQLPSPQLTLHAPDAVTSSPPSAHASACSSVRSLDER